MKTAQEVLQSGLIEQYVLGLTSPAENQQIEAYIKRFPELKEFKSKMEMTMERMAKSQAITPPAGTKECIIRQINELNTSSTQAVETPNTWSQSSLLTMILPIALVALMTTLFFYKFYSLKSDLKNSKEAYTALLNNCEKNEQSLEKQKQYMAFIQNEETKSIILSGTGLSPNSNALVHWNTKENKAIISALNLPAPPKDMTYQIWADIDGKMVDMGVLTQEKLEVIEIPYMPNATSLNITLEKAGGSDHPDVTQLYVNGPIV